MGSPLSPQPPSFPLLPWDQIPDELEDTPESGEFVGKLEPFQYPEIVFGAGSLSNQYNDDDHLTSMTPLRTIRLALRYGICAFDTSPYYGPSEVLLGSALEALRDEFPRTSYQIMTKCGRYGPGVAYFEYSPVSIRAGVISSLQRLKTTYVDTVYLHDVEFVCTPVAPRRTGNHVSALKSEENAYGLRRGDEGKVWGNGDQMILDAIAELRKMKDEGLVKNIGISGYPLATLLRLAILVSHTEPYVPLDVILSYSHLTLQNSTFNEFAAHFNARAKVTQLLCASPLSMGLLTSSPPPSWHPAPRELLAAVSVVQKNCQMWPGGFPNLALGFAIRNTGPYGDGVPLIVGFSNPREVRECVEVWREVREGLDERRLKAEESVREVFAGFGLLDWSWASP